MGSAGIAVDGCKFVAAFDCTLSHFSAGRQAVLSSDFAIARFCFLARLLLVHGHWCYYRLGTMVLYNFYKNAIFVFQLFWFIFYNGFTTQSAIDQFNLLLFSLGFTSVPTVIYGIFEQDASAKSLSIYPQLYKQVELRLTYYIEIQGCILLIVVIVGVLAFTIQRELKVVSTSVPSSGG